MLLGNTRKDEEHAIKTSLCTSMKPNKAMTPHSDSKREPKNGMTVHVSSAIPVLPSATLLSLLQVREHADHRTVQDISGCHRP